MKFSFIFFQIFAVYCTSKWEQVQALGRVTKMHMSISEYLIQTQEAASDGSGILVSATQTGDLDWVPDPVWAQC